MPTNAPQSYEVTEYSEPALDAGLAYGAIRQIFADLIRDVPSVGVWADVSGNLLKIHYHCYEMFLPTRLHDIEASANDVLKKTVSMLKKEFRARTKHDLVLKEKKDLADRTVEKVSLNERYYYRCWRVYEMSF